MGRTETELLSLARGAGIELAPASRVPWLTVHGHLEPSVRNAAPPHVIAALAQIFDALGGDQSLLAAKRGGASPKPDARLGGPHGPIVEIDEVQHFTTDRLRTLQLYPADAALGFDRDHYMQLCARWRSEGDRYRAAKQTKEFARDGGRRAQRAYFDACRDLLAPFLDTAPVIRVPAPECDPQLAVDRLRQISLAIAAA